MANFTVRVDGLDDKIFELNHFSANIFESNQTLSINSSNLGQVKNAFTHFSKLEIFHDNQVIAEYAMFNSYDNISYRGENYDINTNSFYDNLEITLTKVNLVEQVEALNAQINPVIDLDSMTLQELKDYKLDIVGTACQQDVYNGIDIDTSIGVHHYSYQPEDQRNLDSFITTMLLCGQLDVTSVTELPYHYDGGICELMPVSDIFIIFSQMKAALVSKITYGNLLKTMIRHSEDVEWLKAVKYGDDLSPEYQVVLNSINTSTATAMTQIQNALNPED